MKGPAARPNRFWNRASTDAPVARMPGWITSITTAETGPTVQVIRKPPKAMSMNSACRRHRQAEARRAEGEDQHEQRGDAQQRHGLQLGARAAPAGPVDHRAPQHAADGAARAPPAPR